MDMRLGVLRNTDLVTACVCVVLAITACSVYRSRYFQRVDNEEVRLDSFRISPRIFAFKDEKAGSARAVKGTFTVTVRVEDALANPEDQLWQSGQAVIDSLADRFLDRVTAVFVVDSLVLHEIPSTRIEYDSVGLDEVEMHVLDDGPPFHRLLLQPDRRNYSPRRETFLTLKFGETVLGETTAAVRAVLHVTRPGSPHPADSAVFLMSRVDSEGKGLMMFRESVQGY
ncbi:MAG: hypothetical protein AB1772_01095 [Candidatus Zixiibacteriota bacterium]